MTVTGYHADPRDFNIVATRVHRILTLRRQTQPFATEDLGEAYFISLIEKSLEYLSVIHDSSPETWYNPDVGYLIGEESIIFTWYAPNTQSYDLVTKRVNIYINSSNVRYEIESIYRHALTTVMEGGIEESSDMAGVWVNWLLTI